MKNNKVLTSVLAMIGIASFAQAPLPASENFNSFTGTFTQAGWTFNENPSGAPNYSYPSGGVAGTAAGRLDETNDNIVVFVGDQMGQVTFALKGTATAGSWQGVFDVQESTNGSTWTTTLASYTTGVLATTFNTYSVTPSASARYIRWNFTTKVSGYNVAIDDISISEGIAAVQDINVWYNTTNILTNGTTVAYNSPVGTPLTLNFLVRNVGLATLNVSSINFTGANASDYSVVSPSIPFSVNAQSNQSVTISFNPSANGSRIAAMVIASNDPDEASYTINLNGVGGSSASEPINQPSALTFSNIKSYRAAYSFVNAVGGADGYIVLYKKSLTALTDAPTDGLSYSRGDIIGSSKVAYVGTSTLNIIPNVWASSVYQLAVFAYNGSGASINYNTTSPLINSITSSGSMQPANEYNGISTSSATFITDLHNKINPHTSIFYSNYGTTMINLFEARDTTNGQKFVECRYSNYRAVYSPPFDWTNNDFSREHSYCHSWMPTFPADNPEKPEYNDQHHLFPAKQTDVNAERSNFPLGDVVTPLNTFMSCKSGQDAFGQKVFEPRGDQKGNSARALMYVAVAYNAVNGNNWKFKNPINTTNIQYGQDQNLLKKWHYQDPPDSYEISRNDFLDSLQGNRNPFIDSARYACYIDFSNMTYIANPTYTTGVNFPCYVASTVGVKENAASHFEYVLAPNPTSGEFYLMIDATVAEKFNLDITDVSGRIVYNRNVDVANGFNNISVNDIKLQSGIYFVNLIYKNEKITRKLIIQ
jgi:endonuclease I